MREIAFHRLEPNDLFEIERQPSQLTVLGMPADLTEAEAQILADQDVAWTAWVAGRPIACFGISEFFAGRHGLAWSLLAEGIGADHLALTRFMRAEIAGAGLARIELIARAADIEDMAARYPWMDPWALVQVAMAEPTPECRWARLLGFRPAHVLRLYGGASETFMLFERLDGVD